MIQLFHVFKSYGPGHPALVDVNLEIAKGEFVFVSGSSGAGKTTLLKLLFAMEMPDRGQILINGRNVARIRPSQIPYLRRTIGFIFQDFRLLAEKTVLENVALPMRILGAPPRVIGRRVHDVLRLVGLEQKKEARPSHLSGGEQQRVCIARALVNSPPILLADEPTGNLDTDLALEIFELLKQINGKGATVVVATHDRQIVRTIQKRAIVLDRGRLVAGEGKHGS